MQVSAELVNLSEEVAQALMQAVNSLKDEPLQENESTVVRAEVVTKVASREANFVLALKKKLASYKEAPSEDSETALLRITTTCNDHLTYLKNIMAGCNELIAFQNYVDRANDWRENVASTEADIALRFTSALSPIMNIEVAGERRSATLAEIIGDLRLSVIEGVLASESYNHSDIAMLKAMLVLYSIDKSEAVDAVENRQLPKTLQISNFSYGRNMLHGLYDEFRKENANESVAGA